MPPTPIRNENCEACEFGCAAKRPRNKCLVPSVRAIEQCDVMIVAEQPSVQDDTQGQIFCGKSLADIRKFFADNGIKTYCTYALKCPRPEPTFKPKTKHLKVCSQSYLAKEMELVKPKHIITLGSNAYYGIVGKNPGSVNAPGGRYYNEKLDVHMYPTLHQLQATFNVGQKATLYADLERFVGWIKGTSKQSVEFCPPVYVADTLKSLRTLQRRIRESGGVVAVDTETQGLNPYLYGKHIRCIQFCWDPEFGGVFVPLKLEDDCFFTDKNHLHNFWQGEETLEEAVEIIREILLESKTIWHNGKFDREWLYMWGLREFGEPILAPNIYMDTIHAAHAINENRSMKLKQLIISELGYATYDIEDKLTKNLDDLIPYAARDTVATLLLAMKYADILATDDYAKLRRLYTKLIRPMDKLFTDIELRGWPINHERCERLLEAVDKQFDEIDLEMHRILLEENIYMCAVVEETIEVPRKNPKLKPLIRKQSRPVTGREAVTLLMDGLENAEKHNIFLDSKIFASPQKLAGLLFTDLNGFRYLPNPDKKIALTDSKQLSTNEDALTHLKGKPFIDKLLAWRSCSKTRSTYVEPMMRAAKLRGRLTTSYKMFVTVTGRTASGKEDEMKVRRTDNHAMNLQNLPYDKFGPEKLKVRDCIMAEEGWSIVEVDFSQIELRIAGELSGDPLFIKSYQDDKDIHAIRGMRIAGYTPEEWAELPDEKRKELRQKAKAVNFGFLYGMKEKSFQQYALTQYGVYFTYEECVKIRRQFFEDHYGLPKWYKRQEHEALKKGYVESLSGRRRHLPNIKLDPESSREARAKYEEAVRMAVNTPVQGFASDLKLMTMLAVRKILNPDWGWLFGEIHDSILLEIRNDMIDTIIPEILEIMKHPPLLDKLGIELKIPIKAEAKVGPSLGEAKEWHPMKKAA